MEEAKEEIPLKKKTVKEAADPSLLDNALKKMPAPKQSNEEKKSYEKRMARLQEAFKRLKKQNKITG
ncbi:hypothetical protein HY991_04415 [Candidatus Micrarchaeota archaeon]|nr:hypothetical protein [Candidatus Micrarchaeota archaeon]